MRNRTDIGYFSSKRNSEKMEGGIYSGDGRVSCSKIHEIV